tara:strand:+ start:157 stop:336 length:180 start_codon:yes stop_codon:yes gene_type:complete
MTQFELQIGIFIEAENVDNMWEIFRKSGLHDILNDLDAEDGYEAEIVYPETQVTKKSIR